MFNLKLNLCTTDRVIRGVIAVALFVYLVLFYDKIGDLFLQISIFVFAILNLISFIIGWCPVYKIANISTAKH